LTHIEQDVPKIDANYEQTCDGQLVRSELDAVINGLSLNKAPGSDGLTGRFYRHFWGEVRELLHQVFLEIFETRTLPTRHGLIISVPKANPGLIGNRRPVTLRNSDYRLLTCIFASRLQSGLSDIIAETQSASLKGRSIRNNIRLVMDLMEYRELMEDDGFVLFLDFYKAFDWVEHPFFLMYTFNKSKFRFIKFEIQI